MRTLMSNANGLDRHAMVNIFAQAITKLPAAAVGSRQPLQFWTDPTPVWRGQWWR